MIQILRITEQWFPLVAIALTLIAQNALGDEPMGGGQNRNEIRNALHTINNHVRIVHDKLERHEAREHQHGEVLRRLLEAQDKRQRTALDALNKLTMAVHALAEQSEAAQANARRTSDNLMRRLEALMSKDTTEQLGECHRELMTVRQCEAAKNAGEGTARALGTMLSEHLGERMDAAVRAIEKAARADAEKTRSVVTALAGTEERMRTTSESTEALLLKYSKRLDTYKPPSSAHGDWHEMFLGALEAQGHELKKLQVTTTENTLKLRKAAEMQEELTRVALNESLKALGAAEQRLSVDTEKAAVRLERATTEAREQGERAREEILRAVNDLGEQVDTNADSARQAYEDIHGQVLALRSAEKVLIQTADNVLDTKRGVEYGVYQILQETGNVIKAQTKLLNDTLHKRFDGISGTILEHQTGALTNLSQKIEAEISQVWRQIGIMYQQLSASTSALDRLQEQTESYVNGSAAAMDSMEGKVGAIRERMNEVDDNLNYLLGRLSLFSSEFGQVRSGLAEALDDIRKTFEEAQAAVRRAKGPTFTLPEALPPRTQFPRDE